MQMALLWFHAQSILWQYTDMSFWFAHKMGLVASLGGFGRWKQMMNDDRFQVWVWCDGEASECCQEPGNIIHYPCRLTMNPSKLGWRRTFCHKISICLTPRNLPPCCPHVPAVLCKNWKYFSKEKLIFMIAAQDTGPGLRSMQWRHLAIDTSRK